jgi:hypothetical protein
LKKSKYLELYDREEISLAALNEHFEKMLEDLQLDIRVLDQSINLRKFFWEIFFSRELEFKNLANPSIYPHSRRVERGDLLDRVNAYMIKFFNHFFDEGIAVWQMPNREKGFYAAWKAWKTKIVKHRFAYSTISQLSYILSSFMIATPLAITAGTLHIISHSICKIILFYIAGIFSAVYGIHSTGDSAKLAPHIKFWILCLAFCGASIIGFPLLPGSFGKDYMIIADWKTHHYASILFLTYLIINFKSIK